MVKVQIFRFCKLNSFSFIFRLELSLIARIVPYGVVENHYHDLLELNRCDAQTIFTTISNFCEKNNLDIQKICFHGIDGCSAMSGQQNGVSALFQNSFPFSVHGHCRNHRLALCFTRIIPRCLNMVKSDSLLLNLVLILKNSNVKTNIFMEVQEVYGIPKLKERNY